MDAQVFMPDDDGSWLRRNRWRLGLIAAAVAGGIWWRHSAQQRNITVGSVSERWLAERAFEAGQRSED